MAAEGLRQPQEAQDVEVGLLQRRIAGGCNLDRDINGLVREAGFTIDDGSSFYITGPKVLCYMYTGVARPVQP